MQNNLNDPESGNDSQLTNKEIDEINEELNKAAKIDLSENEKKFLYRDNSK